MKQYLPGHHAAPLLLCCLATLMTQPVRALTLATEENAPFNYFDGQRVVGISTDLITEMGHRTGIAMNFQVFPWARAYQMALNNSDTCVYSTVRSPEREALFKWIGPISSNKWALFARTDFKAPSTLEQTRGYRIGGVYQDAKYQYLNAMGFMNFELVSDDYLNLAKLSVGRIDLWISGLYKAREFSLKAGVTNIKPIFIVREAEFFLACNPKIDDAIINNLTQALQTLQKEGYIKALTEHYGSHFLP
jgi:polar amino acid transport system substrate-binding protein